MKRLILSILACLLLAAPALAFDGACQDGEPWQLARMNPAVLGSAIIAKHCDNTDDASILCEDFDGANLCDSDNNPEMGSTCRIGWTVVNGSSTFNFDADHSGTFACSDKSSNALQISKTSDSEYIYAAKTWTDVPAVYVQFYLNIVTKLPNNNTTRVAILMGDSNNVIMVVAITDSGGTPGLRFDFHNGTGTTTGTVISISEGVWYRIRLKWRQSSDNDGAFGAWIGDTAAAENTETNASTYDVDTFRFGNTGSDPDTYVAQYDNLKINVSSAPSACN